jgi:ATP phosphoribosyltransferase
VSQNATPRLSFALPKGRLEEQVQEHFKAKGIEFSFKDRKLVARDEQGIFEFMLVKNVDLPTYVHHGIAGLGVCGEDVLYESGYDFMKLAPMPFGGTRICLAARNEVADAILAHHDWKEAIRDGGLRVASKFTRFTRDYFHGLGIPVDLVKLNGSVELAPVLGLAPFIVDLVETGSTLKANNLKVVQALAEITVHLVANPAYYKFHYRRIDEVLARIV